MEFDDSNNNIVHTNHIFFQTLKQKLAEILYLKREAFHIKTTIWKSEKDTKYNLPDFYSKAN